MNIALPYRQSLAAFVLCLVASGLSPAHAQNIRSPVACLDMATEYATRLADIGPVDELIAAQTATLERVGELARQDAERADQRLREAQKLLSDREAREVERAASRALRVLDNSKSIVAGWRGLYCPVASPTGGAGLTGMEYCNARAAAFVDQLRINRRESIETRAREALQTERQTILKARVTRDVRNDLLNLLRLRMDLFDKIMGLERLKTLQAAAEELLADVQSNNCRGDDLS